MPASTSSLVLKSMMSLALFAVRLPVNLMELPPLYAVVKS